MPFRYHYQFGRMRLRGKIQATAEVLAPLPAAPDDPPARMRLTLRNTSTAPAAGELVLQLIPTDAARWVSASTVPYDLAPGEETTCELAVALVPDVRVNRITVTAPRTPNGDCVATELALLEVMDRDIERGSPLDTVAAVEPLLAAATPYRIRIGDEAMAEIRFAVAGPDLAVSATVTDRQVRVDSVPWRASCLESFGAQLGRKGVGQVFLTPAVDETPARGFRSEKGKIISSPDIRLQSTLTGNGYRLQALIPLTRLALDPDAERLQLEFQVTTTAARGAPLVRGTVFGSSRAYESAAQYGVFHVRQNGGLTK